MNRSRWLRRVRRAGIAAGAGLALAACATSESDRHVTSTDSLERVKIELRIAEIPSEDFRGDGGIGFGWFLGKLLPMKFSASSPGTQPDASLSAPQMDGILTAPQMKLVWRVLKLREGVRISPATNSIAVPGEPIRFIVPIESAAKRETSAHAVEIKATTQDNGLSIQVTLTHEPIPTSKTPQDHGGTPFRKAPQDSGLDRERQQDRQETSPLIIWNGHTAVFAGSPLHNSSPDNEAAPEKLLVAFATLTIVDESGNPVDTADRWTNSIPPNPEWLKADRNYRGGW